MNDLALVVAAYNRPRSLSRVLESLKKAKYDKTVTLIISVDRSDIRTVTKIAEDFVWPFGEKKVIKHEKNLGLRNHILYCGNFTKEFDSIVLIEDDLYLSPYFYEYAQKALNFYGKDERIAGIALYSQQYNMFTRFPFQPIQDKNDVFFLKIPESWGQIWTRFQWNEFYNWYEKYDKNDFSTSKVPEPVKNWSENSWAKYFWLYMIESNKYFVFPRTSYSTQFGDIGIHVKHKDALTQVPLMMDSREFCFISIDDSLAVYDEYYEILQEKFKILKPEFNKFDFEVDLNGTKSLKNIEKEYLLTTRAFMQPEFTFGKYMKPILFNVIFNIPGTEISFGMKNNLVSNQKISTTSKLKDYFFYFPILTTKRAVYLALMKIFKKI